MVDGDPLTPPKNFSTQNSSKRQRQPHIMPTITPLINLRYQEMAT
jgi:hypothetical protein